MSKGARLAIVGAIIIAIAAGAAIAAISMPSNDSPPSVPNSNGTSGRQITVELNESFTMDAK